MKSPWESKVSPVPKGFVYILASPNSSLIKIGGTAQLLAERLREVNRSDAYAEHGPWQISDYLHVTDWQLVEADLHNHFRSNQIRDASGARELFSVPPHEARKRLRNTDAALRVDNEKPKRLFENEDVKLYLFRLFQLSGLFAHLAGC